MPARVEGEELLIEPPLFESKEMGARWDEKRQVYVLPASRLNARMVADAYPDASDVIARLDRSWTPLDDPSGRLFAYQRDVAGRLVATPRGQLVVLSPGLGKTAVSVVAADRVVPPEEKVLVVAPASLLETWRREIAKWQEVPGSVYVVRGAPEWELASEARWIVASWDKVARDPDLFGSGWPLVILDESVMVKNHKSKRFKGIKKLRKGVDRVWLLSGNPTTRHADDLWAQLHLIWPKAYPSYWRFTERFCVTEETPWARTVVGTRARRSAMEENDDLVIVVNQEDVLELPEYLFEVVEVALGAKQRKAYDSMADDFIAELGDGTEVVAQNEVARLLKLQQIASYWDGESAKHDAILELLPTFEGPHLIWTHWREGAEALWLRLKKEGYNAAWVSGSDAPKVRDAKLETFKRGGLDALVLSIAVGKFGHTFTNAKTVHYLDKTWNADDYFQSLRRVRRIGLKHRPVVVTYRAPGTVDQAVELNLEGKLRPISKMTKSDLAELLRGIGKEVVA